MGQRQLFDESDLSNPDDDKSLVDELFTRAGKYRNAKDYNDLIQFLCKFKRYSPFNGMLVHIQKSGSTYVARPDVWLNKYERVITPDAQPLMMLRPGGPVMFVFDVSDTEPASESSKELPEEVTAPFATKGKGDEGGRLERTIRNAVRDGVRVTRRPLGSQQAGAIGPTRTKTVRLKFETSKKTHHIPLRYDMKLNSKQDSNTQYGTLVHELAHLYCGHIGSPHEKWWRSRQGLDQTTEEFEAETVAHLVCSRLDIDLGSDSYLSGYLKDNRDIPEISLDTVLTTARLIEEMGRAKLSPRKR